MIKYSNGFLNEIKYFKDDKDNDFNLCHPIFVLKRIIDFPFCGKECCLLLNLKKDLINSFLETEKMKSLMKDEEYKGKIIDSNSFLDENVYLIFSYNQDDFGVISLYEKIIETEEDYQKRMNYINKYNKNLKDKK